MRSGRVAVRAIQDLPVLIRTAHHRRFVLGRAAQPDNALALADKIVGAKLAACVNVIPGVSSVYEWKGKIEHDTESILMIKTQSSLIDELTEFVKREHGDEVPEVIALDIAAGNEDYLNWIRSVTKRPKSEE